jgi:alkylation response protein AidB-like acyl-CoA dehydrogenase
VAAEHTDIVAMASEIAEEVLFPAALATDAAGLVPVSHLDLLARAGLYGIVGPTSCGGLGADLATFCSVVEVLAGGCLTSTFVWIQHHSVVRAVTGAAAGSGIRERWSRALCAGEVRAGIALGGLRSGPRQLSARPAQGGWLLDGDVPFVSGWGRIDVVLAAALTADGRALRVLVDGIPSASLQAVPLRLVAANASGTVQLAFEDHFVPEDRVVSVETYSAPPGYDGGGRPNGSLALGVAGRCCRLMGPTLLDAELAARRAQLDGASEETVASARAAASEFAFRAAGALAVHTGSGALYSANHAQRLVREALFLLVFGTRPAIRRELLGTFAAGPERSAPPGGE